MSAKKTLSQFSRAFAVACGLSGTLASIPEAEAKDNCRLIQSGKASWYGKAFAGRPTASGDIFVPSKLTAAHKTIPNDENRKVMVESVATGKTVTVEINDHGPHVKGRIIDLSKGAADAIGITGKGVSSVRIFDCR